MTYRCQNNLNLSLLFLWSARASPMRRAALACGDQGLEIQCMRAAPRLTVTLTASPAEHRLPTAGWKHFCSLSRPAKWHLPVQQQENRHLTASLKEEFARNPCLGAGDPVKTQRWCWIGLCFENLNLSSSNPPGPQQDPDTVTVKTTPHSSHNLAANHIMTPGTRHRYKSTFPKTGMQAGRCLWTWTWGWGRSAAQPAAKSSATLGQSSFVHWVFPTPEDGASTAAPGNCCLYLY